MSKLHNVNSSKISEVKRTIDNSKSKIDQIMPKLNAAKTTVNSNWKGEAANLYKGKVDEAIKDLKNIQSLLTSQSNQLRNLASSIANQERVEEREAREAAEAERRRKDREKVNAGVSTRPNYSNSSQRGNQY